jgi:16S rRNA (uracil1498-N3)-methyltransferase
MDPWRFHLADLREQSGRGSLVTLSGEQSHHAQSVLRLKTGDRLILFDGCGAWVPGRLHASSPKGVTALIEGDLRVDPPAPMQLTLATAVPKGDRAEWLVEQASQLNVAAVQWMDCDRSVVKPREGGNKLEKWRRLAVESAKQCGRTHVMRIHEPAPLTQALSDAADRILWLDPAEKGAGVAAALDGIASGRIVALIGPEGGWSDAERALLENAARAAKLARVRLTSTVLRIETACAAIAAVVMSR